MDARTEELRAAHDILAEVYAERLVGALDRMPVERAVLGLFAELVLAAGTGTEIGDIGCGTGRMAPYLADQGFTPHGVDLSPEMVRVARRDQPGHDFAVADLRSLPFADASLDGAIAWYSLMYLTPDDRALAFGELARVIKPGGHVATAFKAGDDTRRRGGESLGLGIGFDIYWLSPAEVERRFAEAGFEVVFWAGRPADPDEVQPQGYAVARRL
ncbi:class I SAM-dependent DNA methyltransferase [Nocardioides sp. T2.26MG-1]|uniref:class I SAM-dependent DNA methyltransferase n=1 Tax=Nocardioides sp. T2.26MG-1 TaxID=3041166 RepID=UPI0024779864|nr:class I SAM-dependent methyltransferase [Nocardioides sp. T2.26MG-1]CAI9399754.1 2-methoxy-6-polyprenyl-1,4-benzoquinol methylase, mitochondrial [Nocardioides sp. T2.26MG-1]